MKKLFFILALTLGLYSCSDVEQSTPARLTVMLEDSPADFEKVNVKIVKLSIFNGTQWYELKTGGFAINVLQYTGGETYTLVSENIPQGEYSQIKFVFAHEDNSVTISKTLHVLGITEADREVTLPIKLNFGSENEYLLCDIDAAASVNETNWMLTPKLKMIDIHNAGAISGVISTAEGKGINQTILVNVTSDQGTVTSTYTNGQNGRLFLRIDEGRYTVSIIPSATSGIYKELEIKDVVVKKGEATKLGAIVLQKILDHEAK